MKQLLVLPLALAVFLSITAYKAMRGKAEPVYLPVMETHETNGHAPDTTLYKYDDRNRIIEIVYPRRFAARRDELSYDDQDRLTMLDETTAPNQLGFTHQSKAMFSYIKNYIVLRLEVRSVKDGKASDDVLNDTLILNDRHHVVMHYGSRNKNKVYNVFKHDSRGNLVWRATYNGSDTLHAKNSTEYVYDDSKSPFIDVRGNFCTDFEVPNLPNNYTSTHTVENSYTPNGELVSSLERNSSFTYQFNDASFPLTVVGKEVDTELKSHRINEPVVTVIKYTYIVR